MITTEEAFNNANERQIKYLDTINNNPKHNIFRISSTLRSDTVSKFLYHYFEEKNIEKAKQNLYTMQKLLEFMNKLKSNKYYPTQINKLFFLCSDNKEVIDNFKNFEINSIPNLEYRLEQGHTLGFVVQEILKGDNQKALYYLKIYEKKHKNHYLKKLDLEILEAIINKDKIKTEELIYTYLLPKNHNKSPEKGMLSHSLISYEATVFAKLSWLKSMEVNIEHPLLPMNLIPIQPNKEYLIEYNFLKPDYNFNSSSKNEFKKSNKNSFLKRFFK